MNTNHVIVSNGQMFFFQDGRIKTDDIDANGCRVDTLAKFLLSLGFTHAWIQPDSGVYLSTVHDPEEWEIYTVSPADETKPPRTFSIRLNEGVQSGRRHIVMMVTHNTRWADSRYDELPGWAALATPKQLLTTILYLEKELDMPMSGNPATIGWKLLQSIHPEWMKGDRAPAVKLGDIHFTPSAGPDIIWQSKDMDKLARLGLYLHKYDKAMAYPYAASKPDSKYGVGTPVHVEHGDDTLHYKGHPQKVGVWRCKVSGAAADPRMPEIKHDEWIAGPLIRLLRSQGCTVEVLEGWVFPEEHTIMADWAARMWRGRQSFKDAAKWKNQTAREFAVQAMKQIAVSTIGFTAYRKFSDDETEKRRPDIRLQTVSRNAELVYHNVLKVAKDTGNYPVLIYMDAVYYLSPEPDGRKALPAIVAREGDFGGYKYEGSIKVDQLVQGILTDKKTNAATKLEALNNIGWSN